MATGLACTVPACGYTTDVQVPAESDMSDKIQLLQIHTTAVHHDGGAARTPQGVKAKMDPPKIQLGVDQQTWDQFLARWDIFKKTMGVDNTQSSLWFFNCLDRELGDEVLKANPGKPPQDLTESALITCTKKLAVKIESKLIHRIRMGQATQSPGSGVNNFLAQLKGLARQCEFTVTCSECQAVIDYSDQVIGDQLVRGLDDQEILADLLGDDKTDRNLHETVQFIARKEQAKLERGTVSCETSSASALRSHMLPSTPNSRSYTCRHCKGTHSGPDTMKTRKSVCPAWDHQCEKCSVKGHYSQACFKCADCGSWGHKSKKSRWCKNDSNQNSETASLLTAVSTSFVGTSIGLFNSVTELRMAAIGNKRRGRKIPLSHHIFEHGAWHQKPAAPQPTYRLDIRPCPVDHAEFGHPVTNEHSIHPVREFVVADSGCQSTAVPPSFAYKIGFRRKDFIPVVNSMNGAGKHDLGVMGAIVLEFSYSDNNGNTVSSRQLCYVCEKVTKVYMSRQGCTEMGMLEKDFPMPKNTDHHTTAVIETPCSCSCPTRSQTPPPLPTALPPSIPETDPQAPEKLKQWLFKHYASTTFNTCEHQQLPMMTGPPLKMFIDPNATPVACHKITPVPIHWKEKVKEDLDRDVKLGVLFRVPHNTPTNWLSRMIITSKANGEPRRTVDFQPLNKHSKRQTFPIQSPFQLATQIPPHVYKTVVDCWNGYHSVPLDPDDRNYTIFNTEWGRYGYLMSPQGYLASGDGYNERLDAITSGFKDHVRCVDDTAMWAKDITSHFLQVCRYLDLCARNGVILNQKKFQFCQETVQFAGLQVTNNSVMPSDKLLDSIKNFPAPQDISGARAWFGLVNQGSYAFAMTDEMAPFRHLLKPKTKFEWTEELDKSFKLSKENIIMKIKQGVELFDTNLPTCLATDFSTTGIGFFLLQKICKCESRVPTCCPEGWRLCLVGSRFLHDAETRYAVIEGEALAVAFALKQCRHFILGCQNLTVVTDHLPLVNILNDRSLADIGNRRLQNLKEKTLSYQFSIAHVPGRKHLGADAASRYPVGPPERLELPGEPAETDFTDYPLTKDLRAMILTGLTTEDIAMDDGCLTEDITMTELLMNPAIQTLSTLETNVNVQNNEEMICAETTPSQNVVTWKNIKMATPDDATIQSVLKILCEGFPDDARQLPHDLRPFFPLRYSLYELDGVLMLGDRIVVPKELREAVLALLHAAHQGVDRMKARAKDAVYWPGMTGDITRKRAECADCNKISKSNPSQPPVPPKEPEYPFQMLAADYFHHMGQYYAVIVDRYSHWPVAFRTEQDCIGSKGLISHLRLLFSTYGVPEEISSDGASEFSSAATQEFLKTWQVHHRKSSVAFPHSNCRAELAVKQIKRILMNNCSPAGSLDTDSFHKAMLSYRNTVDPVTKFSPALAIYGRQMRDGLPVLPGQYNPHNTWQEILDHREHAMAKRHVAQHELWSEHTTKLKPLVVGSKVFIQNQVGNKPRRWDKTGVVMECKDYDQYVVKVDGTGRLTLRNRKFLRLLTPIPKRTAPTDQNRNLPIITFKMPNSYDAPEDSTPSYPTVPDMDSHADQQPDISGPDAPLPAMSHSSPVPASPARCTPPPTQTPSHCTPATPTQQRPQRIRKPNVKYSGDDWDLSTVRTHGLSQGVLSLKPESSLKASVGGGR